MKTGKDTDIKRASAEKLLRVLAVGVVLGTVGLGMQQIIETGDTYRAGHNAARTPFSSPDVPPPRIVILPAPESQIIAVPAHAIPIESAQIRKVESRPVPVSGNAVHLVAAERIPASIETGTSATASNETETGSSGKRDARRGGFSLSGAASATGDPTREHRPREETSSQEQAGQDVAVE